MRERGLAELRERDLTGRIAEARVELARLRDEHRHEAADVERLEGVSFGRVIAAVQGARRYRLAREQLEAEAAALRVRDAESRLGVLERDLTLVEERLRGLAGVEEAYAAVLDDKEDYLRRLNDPRWWQVLELAQEKGRLRGELREVIDAAQAAQTAHEALRVVGEHLIKASRMSRWDLLGRRGMTSASKVEHMDNAADAAAAADRCLAVLQDELAEHCDGGPVAPQLELSRSTRFLDVWFDNLFTDIATGDRIRQASDNVYECGSRVVELAGRLRQRATEIQERLAAIEVERQEVLTRA